MRDFSDFLLLSFNNSSKEGIKGKLLFFSLSNLYRCQGPKVLRYEVAKVNRGEG